MSLDSTSQNQFAVTEHWLADQNHSNNDVSSALYYSAYSDNNFAPTPQAQAADARAEQFGRAAFDANSLFTQNAPTGDNVQQSAAPAPVSQPGDVAAAAAQPAGAAQPESTLSWLAHGVENVGGDLIKGAVGEIANRPDRLASDIIYGAAMGALMGPALAALGVGSGITGAGALAFGAYELYEHGGQWMHDLGVDFDRSGHSAAEVAQAREGVQNMGDGAIQFAAFSGGAVGGGLVKSGIQAAYKGLFSSGAKGAVEAAATGTAGATGAEAATASTAAGTTSAEAASSEAASTAAAPKPGFFRTIKDATIGRADRLADRGMQAIDPRIRVTVSTAGVAMPYAPTRSTILTSGEIVDNPIPSAS